MLSLTSVLPLGESSSGISREDYIGNVAKDIENKMPKVFDLDLVRRHLGANITPTSVVLLQELERFNKLLVRMSRSLAELQRVSCTPGRRAGGRQAPRATGLAPPPPAAPLPPQALAGEVGMSSELDDVAKSLFIGNIPHIWRKLAPDTLKSLGNWMLYFLRRFNQYTYWVRGHRRPAATRPRADPPPRPCADPRPPPRATPLALTVLCKHICVSSSSCLKTLKGAAQLGPLPGESVSAPVHLSP